MARSAVVYYVWLERNAYVKYEEAISNATAVVAVKVIGRSKIHFHLAI